MAIKVLVNGAGGKMGRQVCQAVITDSDLQLAGSVDLNPIIQTKDIGSLIGTKDMKILVQNNLYKALDERPDVVVDFTHPDSVMGNIKAVIKKNIHMVIGTTGIKENDLKEIDELLKSSSSHVLIAPNFAIGAVLMMELAKIASRYMKSCEIIELHHDQKADAPSGTAIKTAEGINIKETNRLRNTETETIEGVRGGVVKGAHIHSIRLPGLVAHQEVLFGGLGQTLTIRHDSISRESFMPGVLMAIKAIGNRPGLTYGLDKILDI